MTSSLSGEGSSLKVCSFSFGSPVRASAVNKPIFEIKATNDNTNISVPMFSGSGKHVLSFGYMDASASPKNSDGGFAAYSRTSGPGGFKYGSSKRGVGSHLIHDPKPIQSMLVVK